MKTFLIFLVIITAPFVADAARVGDKHLGWPGTTLAGVECYGPAQGFGPLDYTDPKSRSGSNSIETVESTHFTPSVENLISGNTSATPFGDLAYTLNAVPNHHRALWSVSKYYLRQVRSVGHEKLRLTELARQGITPPECFFNRAMIFAPEDPMVPAIYGIYLHRRGKLNAALENYKRAEEQLPKHAELSYNMGLLYLDMEDIEKAEAYAERAQELGYPLTGLRKKISRRNTELQKGSGENM